jgi:hypothetical protein
MKKVFRLELDRLLQSNVCEILFLRRRPERAPGRPFFRKMLCSNSMEILNSENGIRSLNFHLPGGPKKIDESRHNVVVVWDIFMQDYRNVSMDKCFLIQTLGPDDFWEYFNKHILSMTAGEKMQFMDTLDELPKHIKHGKNRQRIKEPNLQTRSIRGR